MRYKQTEYQPALIHLLRELTLPKDNHRAYIILTTAPSQWIPQCSGDTAKIIDVSRMTGGSMWRSDIDLLDEALDRIRTAGWPDRLVVQNYHASHAWIRADIALLRTDGTPVALLEVKENKRDENILRQMVQGAKGVSARYAFVYDGHGLLKYDLETDSQEVLECFPCPIDLGLRPLPLSPAQQFELSSGVSLIRISEIGGLVEELNKSNLTTVIIDQTMPWWVLSSTLISEARKWLPEELQTKRLDSLSLLAAVVASNKHVQRLIVIGPSGLAFSASSLPLRNFLAKSLGLSGVIELPAGFFAHVTSIPTTIFVLGRYSEQNNGNVAFASVPDNSAVVSLESQRWFNEFLAGLRGQQMMIGFTAKVPPGSQWSAHAHSPAIKFVVDRISKLGNVIELGDVYDVIAGYRHSRQESRAGKSIKVVRGRDLGVVGLTKDDLTAYEATSPVPPQCLLSSGDILLQRVGFRPKAMVITPDLEGTAASDTVIVLRPKREGIDPYWVVQFLMSATGRVLLNARVNEVGAPTLALTNVRTIPLPIPSESVSRDLITLQDLEQTLRARADTMASSRLDLFSADSPEELHSRLRSIRKMARVTAESMKQTDSLQFRVRNFYPFPIAYTYRLLGGLTDPQELYREQLRVAENILAFLASITLSMLGSKQRTSLGINLPIAWQGGISPGTWRQIAQNGSKMLDQVTAGESADLFAGLWSDTKKDSFQDCINNLIVAKNDFKHDRGPKGADDCRECARKIEKKLDKVIEALDFLTECPILLIRDLDTIRGSHTVIVKALQCVGDHPGLPQVELQHGEPLKKGDLYIQTGVGNLVPLFPFITAQNCPTCNTREIYFIDRYDSRPGKKTILKSFERGHTEENEEVAEALQL